jgi:hypothetical protein
MNKNGWLGLPLLLALTGVAYMLATPPAPASGTTGADVETEEIARVDEAALEVEAARLDPVEMRQFRDGWLAVREAAGASVDNSPWSPAGLPLIAGRETEVAGEGEVELLSPGPAGTDEGVLEATGVEPEFHGTPSLFVIGRNNKNTRANAAGGSTLAEPAAANNARLVFAAGNLSHTEYSTNGGVTWTNLPLPGGPGDAPLVWGDMDAVIDDARRVIFHSNLYLNAGQTNGIVRLFVRRSLPTAPGLASPPNCAYDIDPGGAANNLVPDYPHLGLTKRFLYLATANFVAGNWTVSQMRRFDLDRLVECPATITASVFNSPASPIGQRTWVPAEGTNDADTMYWGQVENNTTFRIFQWTDAAAAPSSVIRAISPSQFFNATCRGGVNDVDFIERSSSWDIRGYRLRGALGRGLVTFVWNAAPDGVHTQEHVHAAQFRQVGLSLVSQPHVFSNSLCTAYPSISANKRGDLGVVLVRGGRSIGGGGAATAVKGYVALEDEFTPGTAFSALQLVADGTHNPDRFGDYFTIHPHEPEEKFFSATAFAFLNGTALANVNSRYVEFGRRVYRRAYLAHRDQFPVQ